MTIALAGMTLDEWRACEWWPNGKDARVEAGPVGHESELVVNIGELGEYDGWRNPLPRPVAEVFAALLPDVWKVQDRGSRIEVHPTGLLYGGFHASTDLPECERALREMGFCVDRCAPSAPALDGS